jgi:uncharacterized protein YndB with AHSA1/START domain
MRTEEDAAPLVKSVEVEAAPEEAFRVFTERIASWWPVDSHSVDAARVAAIAMEGRVGGRLLEIWSDGESTTWGEVLRWEPPAVVAFSWHPNPDRSGSTEVEVRFAAIPGGTRVVLVHRGWERLGDSEGAQRSEYDPGWSFVLGRYAAAAAGLG